MDQKKRLTRSEIGHEIVGLLVMLGLVLGAVTLRYALFLPQFFD